MNVTQTGIAVALALVVVAAFFIFPGLWPFPSVGAAPTTADQSQQVTLPTDTSDQASSTTATMPTTTTADGLQITDETIGTGATAAAGDRVTVTYVGTFTNGTVFDASANHPETANGFPFVLGAGNVIKGWDEGVAGMKVGGKRKLVIPANLGYGAQDYGPIPGNSTLIFEIELLGVQPQ